MTKDNIDLLISPELELVLNTCVNLPTLPAVALKIIEASKDPDITLHEVAAIISSDPAISIKVLKIANSPLYSQRRSLCNLREALTLLGFNASLTISLSFSLLKSFGSSNDVNYENYWKRSILAASIARLLGTRLRITRLEDLFLASLLQDIGVLVIQCIKNSPYPENKNLKHVERIKFEQEMISVDHSVIGAWLLKSWNMPEYLIKSVLHSHSLEITELAENNDESYFHYCLNLSGLLADVWLDNDPGKSLHSIFDVVKKVLKYNDDDFNQLIVDIDNSLPDISAMFETSLVGHDERQNVIHEARELLLERSLYSIKQSEDDRRYIDSITSRVEQIEKESRIDHLTKIYNRQHIDHLLEIEYEESNINRWPISLAFIDIDNFKLINDKFGHLVGDELIKLISGFFSKNIRETDVIARYGGDEFLLMLPGSTSEIAEAVLERLLTLLKDKAILNVKGVNIMASVSIGLASHMDKNDFDTLKEFIAAADEALYKAKASGKNCIAIY